MHHSDDEKIASWPSKDSNSRIRNKMNQKTNKCTLIHIKFSKYKSETASMWKWAVQEMILKSLKQNETTKQIIIYQMDLLLLYSIFK